MLRREDPSSILEEIEKGYSPAFKAYRKIPDRFRAVEASLAGREASDIVVIAGKGHEDYQIIGDEMRPYNDKRAVKMILRAFRTSGEKERASREIGQICSA